MASDVSSPGPKSRWSASFGPERKSRRVVGSRRLRSVQGARELVAARRAPGGALTAVAFTTRPELKGTKRSAGSSRSFATTGQALRPVSRCREAAAWGYFATPTWPPPTAGSRVRRRSRAANDAPMFHTTHVPSSVAPHGAPPGRMHSEPMPDGVLEELRRRGHEVVEEARWSLGRICAVGRNPQTGILSAAASLRGAQAYAAGR